MTPSKEAIDAASDKLCRGPSLEWTAKALLAAYSIDFAALQQENDRLKAELEGRPVLQTEWEQLVAERDRIQAEVLESRKDLEGMGKALQFEQSFTEHLKQQLSEQRAEIERLKTEKDEIHDQLLHGQVLAYQTRELNLLSDICNQRTVIDGLVKALQLLLKNYHLAYEDRQQANDALSAVEKLKP